MKVVIVSVDEEKSTRIQDIPVGTLFSGTIADYSGKVWLRINYGVVGLDSGFHCKNMAPSMRTKVTGYEVLGDIRIDWS